MSTQKQCPEPALVFPCIISISIIFTGNPVRAQPYSFIYEWEGAMHTLLPLGFSLAPTKTSVSIWQLGSDSFISSYIVFYYSKIINFKNYSFLYGKNCHKPIQTKYDLGDVFATHMTEGANITNTYQKTHQICIFWLCMRLTKFC